jgi:hypothetical protein
MQEVKEVYQWRLWLRFSKVYTAWKTLDSKEAYEQHVEAYRDVEAVEHRILS